MVFHPPAPAESPVARPVPSPNPAERPTEPLEPEQRLISLPQALSSYNQNLLPLPIESVATEQALNRCLAESPLAGVDLPGFTQSAVDGYALLSFETNWASPDKPVRLRVIGEIAAGPRKTDPPPLAGNMAYRILTGASIPRGVDTVVPQEVVKLEGDSIRLEAPVLVRRNIRYAGEELKRGDVLAAPGQRVSPGLLAALMAAGTHTLRVYRRPRVGVLVTGDEVVPAGQLPAEGQVHDANAPLIRNWMVALGYPAPTVSYVKDVRRDVETALAAALDSSDLVITSGGVSVGSRDYLPVSAQACGVRRIFWKVAQKPGKPLFFGLRDKTPLLALPGNPAAVLV
ncbi:MAG: molybdopterin molybdotransferase MoeA, partial [Nevskiales bacterium]